MSRVGVIKGKGYFLLTVLYSSYNVATTCFQHKYPSQTNLEWDALIREELVRQEETSLGHSAVPTNVIP